MYTTFCFVRISRRYDTGSTIVTNITKELLCIMTIIIIDDNNHHDIIILHCTRYFIYRRMILTALRELWPWKEIRNCPGRYVVSKCGDDIPPERLLELLREKVEGKGPFNVKAKRFVREPEKDDVFVAAFLDQEGGGLITFCKKAPNKGFVHTLNEPEGLERKLLGLGYYEEILGEVSSA